MAIPQTLGLGMNLIPSVMQMVKGFQQKKQAKNLKKSNYVPESLVEVEKNQRLRAGATEAPGQARAENNIRKSTASTVDTIRKTAKNSASIAEQIQAADASEKNKMADVNARVAQYQDQTQRDLNSTLGKKAAVEQDNQNKYDAAKSALLGASDRNMYNALTSAVSAGNIAGTGSSGGATPDYSGVNTPTGFTPGNIKKWLETQFGRNPQPGVWDPNYSNMGFMSPNA